MLFRSVAAPFVPFMTDEIYQNLVVGLDKKAPESIHLCLWPEYDETAVDKKLEQEMDLAYTIVKLGRSARNSVNIKNRQKRYWNFISAKRGQSAPASLPQSKIRRSQSRKLKRYSLQALTA